MINKKQFLLSFILIIFLFNIDIIITSVLNSSYLFFNNVFVSIFPFIILSDILIYYDYHVFISKTIGKYISKLFNIDSNSTIVFIMSMLTSQPSNSIYLNNLLNKKIISEKTADKILTYTFFPSIAFVIGTIGYKLYNNINIGILLLITNYLCNISIGIYLRKYRCDENIINIEKQNVSFFTMLKESIIKSINICFIILGNIIIFSILTNIINNYLDINPIVSSILTGLFEITNGINNISLLNIPLDYKIMLTSFILNFSGLSILFQSKSILSEYKINIEKILIIKLVFSLIFSILLKCAC